MEIDLDLASGGKVGLKLPEPGQFPSFYVIAMEFAADRQFWRVLERLMAAAGRPVCHVPECLRNAGVGPREITSWSMRRLLEQQGYGFGVFFAEDSALDDILASGCRKLLFIRDPLDALAARYRQFLQRPGAETTSFAEFLRSPGVEQSMARWRWLAELRRRDEQATVFRYEHALSDWNPIAVDMAAALDLPVDPATIASIAASFPPLGRLPELQPDTMSGSNATEIAHLEARLAGVLAILGYGSRTPACPCADSTAQRQFVGLDAILEPDPVLLARLRPNASAEMGVLGQTVVMEVDATGCRPVIGQPASGEKTLAAYGCAYTYGAGVRAAETFCSLLQTSFPVWRIENHGVPAYSTAQNLIQLERDTRWNQPELVTFCWTRHHLVRNVAAPAWVQRISEKHARPGAPVVPQGRLPRATLDADGRLQMRSVRMPRADLAGIDLADFAPDHYYLDLICFRVLERAHAIVTGYGGHFFVTTLEGQHSPALAGWLADAGIPVVAAAVGELPDDALSDAAGHRMWARKMGDYLRQFE